MEPGEFIAITPEMVRSLGGANAALVWSRINFVCQVPGLGRVEDETGRWWVTSMPKLSEDTGLSLKAVRGAVDGLLKSGAIESSLKDGSSWDRSKAYRAIGDVVAGRAHLPSGADASALEGRCIGPQGQIDLPLGADVPYGEEVKKKNAVEIDRDDVLSICNLLASRMVENGCRKPTITAKWKTDIRLLLDKDGVSVKDAAAITEWSQRSEFWKANIHSPAKLRAKFDTLRLQMERDGTSLPATAANVEDWLRECWQGYDTKAIEARSGLTFQAPDLPADVTDVRAFNLQARRDWITTHREEITQRIMTKEASAA